MENNQIYNLYNKELSDLMIGHNLNNERIQYIIDLVAEDLCKHPDITELWQL